MRLALADAGDGMDDANFVHDTADKGILRLTKVNAATHFVLRHVVMHDTAGKGILLIIIVVLICNMFCYMKGLTQMAADKGIFQFTQTVDANCSFVHDTSYT